MSEAAWECLHRAAMELAKPAALKQRLTDAYTRHLIDLPAQEMPEELRKDLEALRQSMTRIKPQHGESPVTATVRKMSIGEADACAARIVALLDSVHRTSLVAGLRANGQPQSRATGGDAASSRVPTLISINRA